MRGRVLVITIVTVIVSLLATGSAMGYDRHSPPVIRDMSVAKTGPSSWDVTFFWDKAYGTPEMVYFDATFGSEWGVIDFRDTACSVAVNGRKGSVTAELTTTEPFALLWWINAVARNAYGDGYLSMGFPTN